MSVVDPRRKRLERILRVKEQMRLLEEWRLAKLVREREALDADDAAALESLGDFAELAGLFVENKVRTLRRNEVRRTQTIAEEVVTGERIKHARRQEKGVERLHQDVTRSEAREGAAQSLQTSIDAELARRRASFE